MTVQQAIHQVDTLYPNAYSRAEKIRWLSAVEGILYHRVYEGHQDAPDPFTGFSQNIPLSTALLVPEPFSEAYIHYLQGQMLYASGEIQGYNNAMALFNRLASDFWRYYHAFHKPLGKALSVLS